MEEDRGSEEKVWEPPRSSLISRASFAHYLHTVEVGSLHTLRLESLKLVFQPLHKCIVNKLVRTSTLCMTQVIFSKIVYRQIISLISLSLYHNSSWSEVYIQSTKCAFKQLGKFQKMMSWL